MIFKITDIKTADAFRMGECGKIRLFGRIDQYIAFLDRKSTRLNSSHA